MLKAISPVAVLSVAVAVLAAVSAGLGLFERSAGTEFTFTTLRGQAAQIYGQGLYRFDTVFFGAGFKGQDAVVLFFAVPALLISLVLFLRGSLSGHLLLLGAHTYLLYVYASMALGAAYNKLFLVYVAIFGAALFAFIQLFESFDLHQIPVRSAEALPSQSLGIFMLLAGLVTVGVWGGQLVAALVKGTAPDRMDTYTTMVTYAIDLAVITPSCFLCAFLVFRSQPLGYLIAVPLLSVIIFLAPQIILSTLFQRSAGVPFTTGEMVGPVSGFVVLGLVAGWLLVSIARGITFG